MFSAIALVTLFTTALAAPATSSSSNNGVENVVPTSTCTTSASGTLSANSTTGAFAINNNTLVFDPSAQGQGLVVQFQACNPNFGGFENTNRQTVGHVFVPSINQCLLVQDVDNLNPGVLTGPCETPDDSRQILLSWMKKDNQVFWSGETKADGTLFQGAPACTSGIYGFQRDASGSAAAGDVTLACTTSDQGSIGFEFSQ